MLRPNSGNKHATNVNADVNEEGAQDEEPASDRAAHGSASPPGVKRERNAAATRQRILDAGEREFAARGFAGARLREIAVTAGVQPALIHHYFIDKHGLYRAVLDRALLPSSTESWSLLGSELGIEGLVGGFIEVLLRFYARHSNLLSILRHEALSGSTVLDELTRERTLPIVEAISALLAEKQRAGEIRGDIPPAEIIAAGMGMVVFPFVEEGLVRVMMPSLQDRDDAALMRRKEVITRMLLAALAPVEASVEAPAPAGKKRRER